MVVLNRSVVLEANLMSEATASEQPGRSSQMHLLSIPWADETPQVIAAPACSVKLIHFLSGLVKSRSFVMMKKGAIIDHNCFVTAQACINVASTGAVILPVRTDTAQASSNQDADVALFSAWGAVRDILIVHLNCIINQTNGSTHFKRHLMMEVFPTSSQYLDPQNGVIARNAFP